jgi:hypothetical protein
LTAFSKISIGCLWSRHSSTMSIHALWEDDIAWRSHRGAQRILNSPLHGVPTVRGLDLDSPQGVNPDGLFYLTRWNLWLRTPRFCTSTRNTENTVSLYWLRPPESKTLCLVIGVDCLRIAYCYKESPCPPYIGQQTRSVPRLLVGYDQET